MYIKSTFRFYSNSGIHVQRAWFLILAQSKENYATDRTIRCFVRKVALSQLGHFMMGYARIYNHSVTISGAYGNDGLTVDLPHAIWEKGLPLPDHLYSAWANGGGWNSAGSEAPALKAWALENMDELCPKKRGFK